MFKTEQSSLLVVWLLRYISRQTLYSSNYSRVVERTFIWLLLGLTVNAGACFYLGYWRPGRRWRDSRLQTGFYISLLFLVPLCLYVLFTQSRVPAELSRLGIPYYPGIEGSLGLPINPQTVRRLERLLMAPPGTNPVESTIWVFRLRTSAHDALQFYRTTPHFEHWTLHEDSGMSLIYQRDGWQLSITASDWAGSTLIITLRPGNS